MRSIKVGVLGGLILGILGGGQVASRHPKKQNN